MDDFERTTSSAEPQALMACCRLPERESPEDAASTCNKLCFCWVWQAVVAPAWRRAKTTKADLPVPSERDDVERLHRELRAALRQVPADDRNWVTLWREALRLQWRSLLWASGLMLISVLMSFAQPVVIEVLLDRLSQEPSEIGVSLLLAAGLFLSIVVGSIAIHSFWFESQRSGIAVSLALATEVFRKSLFLGPSAHVRYGQGELTQLMSVDAQRLTSGYVMPLLIWGTWPPVLTLIVALFNLYRLLGWPALIAAAVVSTVPFVNGLYLSDKLHEVQTQVQGARDKRTRMASELLKNIRTVKVLGWEAESLERLDELRRRELRAIRTDLLWRIVNGAFVLIAPAVASSLMFALYSLVEGEALEASTIFAAAAWLGTIDGPMWQIPAAVRSLSTTSVSMKRLAKYFWEEPEVKALSDASTRTGVRVENATVSWTEVDPDEPTGRDEERSTWESRWKAFKRVAHCSIVCCCPPARRRTVTPGEDSRSRSPRSAKERLVVEHASFRTEPGLVVILGSTGAGKSSLLAAITGQCNLPVGTAAIAGRLSYVGQTPWLMNSTVRENITFARPFQEEWFRRAIAACALEEDVASFPKGVDTVIGEHGITISGGQRARIALARALYSDSDVFVLDDPLAALDASVAKTVLERAILGYMSRNGRSCIMATNLVSLSRHPATKAVYWLKPTPAGMALTKVVTKDAIETAVAELSPVPSSSPSTPREELVEAAEAVLEGPDPADRAVPTMLVPVVDAKPTSKAMDDAGYRMEATIKARAGEGEADDDDARTSHEEGSASGFIKLRVLMRYCGLCGSAGFALGFFMVLLVREAFLAGSDLWLTVWIDADMGYEPGGSTQPSAASGAFDGGIDLQWMCAGESGVRDPQCYSAWYATFALGSVLLAMVTWGLSTLGSLSASESIHRELMGRLMRAPIGFFDETATGMILNRAVKDMQAVDLNIATTLRSFMFNALRVFTATVLVAAGSPWVLLALGVMAIPYYALALRFRHAARDLQRLSSAANSPILTLFGEVVRGAHVVRTFDATEAFMSRHRVLARSFGTRSVLLMAVEQWATIWLEVFGSGIVLAAALLAVIAGAWQLIPVSIVGFIITQAQSVPSRLLWVTRTYASLELSLVAAERVFEFMDIPDENRSVMGRSPMATGVDEAEDHLRPLVTGHSPMATGVDEAEDHLRPLVTGHSPMATGVDEAEDHAGLGLMESFLTARRVDAAGEGAVTLSRVHLQYRRAARVALKELTLFIPARSKVAIVGRSGAGKTSLFAALLKTHEYSGRVLVDEAELSSMTPQEARRLFAVLQQEGCVFEGTVRENLLGIGLRGQARRRPVKIDPRGFATAQPSTRPDLTPMADAQCERAIRAVGLDKRLPTLDTELSGQDSLSRGESQLLGLARCLVRLWMKHSKVVLADEATSSVDHETDEKVNDILLSLPQTVITICHRLDHIHRYDQVIVMENGRVEEQGAPADLLGREGSRLAALLEDYSLHQHHDDGAPASS
jgi:ATP-binding cassette, subfamily C (CFTR/MRP), member 1